MNHKEPISIEIISPEAQEIEREIDLMKRRILWFDMFCINK